MKRVLWLLQFLLVLLLALPLAVLPSRLSLRLGECLGGLLFYLWRSRRMIAIANLEAAVERGALSIDFGPEAVIQKNFRNLGKFFAEVARIYCGFGEGIIRSVEIRGAEHYLRAREQGTGILFITGHCGNWSESKLLGIQWRGIRTRAEVRR